MKVGDLVMKRDGHIKTSPHYKRLGLIIDLNQRRFLDGTLDNPIVRVRWADDYGTFWTSIDSLQLVSEK
jgi:hypothetical protein